MPADEERSIRMGPLVTSRIVEGVPIMQRGLKMESESS